MALMMLDEAVEVRLAMDDLSRSEEAEDADRIGSTLEN
jgi:hypothetical protein